MIYDIFTTRNRKLVVIIYCSYPPSEGPCRRCKLRELQRWYVCVSARLKVLPLPRFSLKGNGCRCAYKQIVNGSAESVDADYFKMRS
jgi:hypothetical protein